MFAEFPIAAETIFYRSALSFAFVNLKPMSWLAPKRVCYHLTDLTDAETADLFVVSKKVQRMLEKVRDFALKKSIRKPLVVQQHPHYPGCHG
ncbi:hypothetical protein COOONC_10310 [Cooperia oncophora]